MTFRYSWKKTGHHTLVSPEMRKNHSQNVQFFNSVTPRLQSTDVNNILMSLLHSLLLSKHVACWQSFKLKPSWGLSVLRNYFEFSTLAFHSINVSSGHCFPMRSKVITWLVKDCCDTLIKVRFKMRGTNCKIDCTFLDFHKNNDFSLGIC